MATIIELENKLTFLAKSLRDLLTKKIKVETTDPKLINELLTEKDKNTVLADQIRKLEKNVESLQKDITNSKKTVASPTSPVSPPPSPIVQPVQPVKPQQPAPSPKPPTQATPQPKEPSEAEKLATIWQSTGLTDPLLTTAQSFYQPTDIIAGKYLNIDLKVGDKTEKNNIQSWRKVFATDNPPFKGFELGDIDQIGEYNGITVDGSKTKDQIDSELGETVLWNNFFTDHQISQDSDKTLWQAHSLKDAKELYQSALQKDHHGNPWNPPLSDSEQEQINTATNPEQVKNTQTNIFTTRLDTVWDNFFTKHALNNATDQNLWKNDFNTNSLQDILTAEKIYTDAIASVDNITPAETNLINQAFTPSTIQEIVANIPWQRFFASKSDLTNLNNWKNSDLTIPQSEQAYANGWKNNNNPIVNNQKTYWGETFDPTAVNKGEFDKSLSLLKDIKKSNSIEQFCQDFGLDTQIKVYQENQVPTSYSFVNLLQARNNKHKELFKNAFESPNASGLSPADIANWRKLSFTKQTGLSGNGSEERQVFNNGWADPAEIKDKKIAYQGISNIEVSTIKKGDIDEEIKKADAIFEDISKQISLHDLTPLYKQSEIDPLNNNLLSASRQKIVLEKKRTEIRDGLWFNLNSTDPRDGGIETILLNLAETEEQNSWAIREYKPLTPEVLNEFLAACEGVKAIADPSSEKEINQLLKDEGAFEIDEVEPGISDKEEALTKATKGTCLLPLFYKMNNYDKDNPDFCQWENVEVETETEDKTKPPIKKEVLKAGKVVTPAEYPKIKKISKRKIVIDPTLEEDLSNPTNPKNYTVSTIKMLQDKYFVNGKFVLKGHLAIGTGVGKTTKTINCLRFMMDKLFNTNVILVCPTLPLAQSAYNHQKGWLQEWGCVVHQEKESYVDGDDGKTKERYQSHGSYKVEMNKLVNGLSVMEPEYLFAYLARTLVDISKLDSSKGGKAQTPEQKKAFEEAVAKIKDEVIPDGTLIVFDEADYAIPEYQELIRDTIFLTDENDQAKFRVLKMSATFKGKKFSITSSYPIQSYTMSGLSSGTPLKLEERLANGKTLLFLKSIKERKDDKGNVIGGFGAKQEQILKDAGVCYVTYDEAYEAYMEGISFGLPNGSLGIGDTVFERGFTPDIDNCFSTGLIEMSSLGEFCRYSKPVTQNYPISSGGQQRGRVGRIQNGFWGTLSTKFEEVKIIPDLISDMVKAVVNGVISKNLANLGGGFAASLDPKTKFHHGVNFVRAGVALYQVMNNKATAPEQLLVGLQGLPEYPTFRTDYPSWNPDKNLWARYRGEPEPDAVVWDEERINRSKDLLKLMIQTFISNDSDFPNKLNVSMKSSLVDKVGMTENEVRQVLNALIVKKIKEHEAKDNTYDKVNKRGKTLSTIKKIAELHRIVLPADKGGTQINMGWEKDDSGGKVYMLRMQYNI